MFLKIIIVLKDDSSSINTTNLIMSYDFLVNVTNKKYLGKWKSTDRPSYFFENNNGILSASLDKNYFVRYDKVQFLFL